MPAARRGSNASSGPGHVLWRATRPVAQGTIAETLPHGGADTRGGIVGMGRQRRAMVGLALAAGIVGAALAGWFWRGGASRRVRGRGAEEEPRQWPMDRAELAAAMDRALREQRGRLADVPAGPTRNRVANFLHYYERRRAAI